MKRLCIALILSVAAASPAFAHLNPAEHGSFAAGLSHPLFGADHILAMIGVGLWAFVVGGHAIWAIPAAFVVTMMVGFVTALAGIGLPFVEPAIAASVVVLGLLALTALRLPVAVGMAVVGFFALFHGYAHGGELGSATSLPFMAGFALATALLHAAGLGIGLAGRQLSRNGLIAARIFGGLTTLGGLWLFTGA